MDDGCTAISSVSFTSWIKNFNSLMTLARVPGLVNSTGVLVPWYMGRLFQAAENQERTSAALSRSGFKASEQIGTLLAETLLAQGGKEILEELAKDM